MAGNMLASHICVKINMTAGHSRLCLPGCMVRAMDNLRFLRKQRGLTQVQLSEKAGIDQGFLSKLENGETNITLDKIKDLAAALNVHPAQMFALPELQNRAMLALSNIDPLRQEAAVTVLEAMTKK